MSPIFGRKNKLPDLIIGWVSREPGVEETWTVDWDEGFSPIQTNSLDDALDRATKQVAASYAAQADASTKAEVHLAIYPWAQDAQDIVLDIQRAAGEWVATEITGSGLSVRGESLDELVANAETIAIDRPKIALRWIRRVVDLA